MNAGKEAPTRGNSSSEHKKNKEIYEAREHKKPREEKKKK